MLSFAIGLTKGDTQPESLNVFEDWSSVARLRTLFWLYEFWIEKDVWFIPKLEGACSTL